MREDRVISEHSLGSLLLDTSDRGGFLPQHLVQVLHDLQLLSPLILLPSKVTSALGSPLYGWGMGGWRRAWGLGSVLTLITPALDDHPLRLAKVQDHNV